MLASDLITRASHVLNDAGVRWIEAEMLRWLSDAQREVVLHKPEASVVSGAVQLAANLSKQAIPAAGHRLIDIIRNMGADGTTPGEAITLVQRETLDAFEPTWHTSTVAASIKNYVFDSRNPKTYYVYPRPNAAIYIEAVYSSAPAELANAAASIALDDIYANAILDFALHRAFLKDAGIPNYAQRATLHYSAFAAALGIKAAIEMKHSPNSNSPFNPQNPVPTKAPGGGQ